MRNKIKVLYLHGLESEQGGDKVDYLAKKYEVVAPAMDYYDPQRFVQTVELVKEFEPDVIIGSSMGGYFAYKLATIFGTPVVLLNPAMHSRYFEPEGVYEGTEEVIGTMIMGHKDDVIDPKKTINLLRKGIRKGQLRTYLKDHEHRTPLKIFKDYL